MSNERLNDKGHELSPEKRAELENAGNERSKELQEQLERRAEHSKEQDAEKLRNDAENIAEKEHKDKEKEAAHSPAEKHKEVAPRHRKKAGEVEFKKTMRDVQSQMKPASRTFSKVIHNKAVEKTSEVVGGTVARPNALLSGAVTAFILTLGVYLVAKYFGYPLSGSESIAAFLLGWIIGLLFDYVRLMATGKRS